MLGGPRACVLHSRAPGYTMYKRDETRSRERQQTCSLSPEFLLVLQLRPRGLGGRTGRENMRKGEKERKRHIRYSVLVERIQVGCWLHLAGYTLPWRSNGRFVWRSNERSTRAHACRYGPSPRSMCTGFTRARAYIGPHV